MWSGVDLFLFFEIFRFTYFLIVHGARASCKVIHIFEHFHLFKVVWKILTVKMDISEENVLSMEKYKALIEDCYQEPMDGFICYRIY